MGEILIPGLSEGREFIFRKKGFDRLLVQFYPVDMEVQSMEPKKIFRFPT